MSINNNELQLMFQVCQKYFIKKMTKMEIGTELHISRFKVARLIDKALSEGYVKIELVNFPNTLLDLGAKLEEKLGLKSVIVIDTDGLGKDETHLKVQKESANYLSSILSDNDILGVSMGVTLAGITKFLPDKITAKNLNIVQMTGGFHLLKAFDAATIIASLAEKFSADINIYFAPPVVDSQITKETLLKDKSIKTAVDLFEKITISIAAIGSWSPEFRSNFYKTADISEQSKKRLAEKNVCGDIANHIYDKDGNILDKYMNEKLMAIEVDALKKIPCKIAVCADFEKSDAVTAAVKTGLIDVLIIDSYTAKTMLKKL